jgi:hypothetical protein
MNYKHTLKAAMADLHEINDLLDSMYNKNTFSAIELDLALQKVRNLYDIMLMIRPEEIHIANAAVKGELIDEVDTKNTVSETTLIESTITDEKKKGTVKSPAGGERAEKTDEEKKTQQKVLSEKISEKKLLHDDLHQKVHYKDVSSRVQAKPVSDISAAIGINERYLYIRELFNNNTREYEHAISILNDSANFNEAYNYMIREYDWNMDSELVQGLLEIVRRKFITGQHE